MRDDARLGLATVALALAMTWSGEAHAKRQFADIVKSHLGLSYDVPCRLCHIQGTTGPGSVQTPFGVSMLARGLTGSEDTVVPALDALDRDMVDSDGDGIPDIVELRPPNGTDPNTPAPVLLAPGDQNPSYGCAVSPRRPSIGGVAALLVALIAVRARRRRHVARVSSGGGRSDRSDRSRAPRASVPR